MKIDAADIVDTIKSTAAFSPPVFTVAGFSLEEWMYWVSIVAALFLILERVPKVIISWREMWRKKKNVESINKN